MVNTVYTNSINHDPPFVMSGAEVLENLVRDFVWPGASTNDLPAFVAMIPSFPKARRLRPVQSHGDWAAGGQVVLRSGEDPVLYIDTLPVSGKDRRAMLDALGKLNRRGFKKFGDPDIQTRISQYEMAYRMQTSVPELTDLSKESKATSEMAARRSTPWLLCPALARPSSRRTRRPHGADHIAEDSHNTLLKQPGNQCRSTGLRRLGE